MALLTDTQHARMREHADARERDPAFDPVPVVKLHTLDAGAVWLLTELDVDGDRAYGLCDAGIGAPELGHISLAALEAMRGPRGMPVMADPHFNARQTLSAYVAQALLDGSISD
jgi:hypothetical protein